VGKGSLLVESALPFANRVCPFALTSAPWRECPPVFTDGDLWLNVTDFGKVGLEGDRRLARELSDGDGEGRSSMLARREEKRGEVR